MGTVSGVIREKCTRISRETAGIMRRMMLLLVVGALWLGTLAQPVQAQHRRGPRSAPSGIPEDQRPSRTLPWVVGGVLSAGAVLVGLKNAKRTHLD